MSATDVCAAATLSAGSGSSSAAPAETPFEMSPGVAGVTTTIVIGGAAPTASGVARVQVTMSEASLQSQPVPVAETKVTPAGSASVATTLVAGLGPPLVT